MSPSNVTLLNVDDSEVARYTKSRTLRHAGFHVVDAVSGTEALQLMEMLRPALALLDVKLPDINGIELCKQIKQRWPSTLVLQTSATFVGPSDRARGLEGGADAYLAQPIDADELVAGVRALLRLHAAEEATRALNETLEQRIKERTRDLHLANEQLREQIAQRERAEAALVQSQKMQAVGQLTGAMAHDFNNILASIVGYIHVMRLKTKDSELLDLTQRALAAGERGGKLTARMLAFARTELPSNRPVDVKRLVLGMQEWLQQSAGSAIPLKLDFGSGPFVVATDANQLELALLNLVLNARDAMPEGGSLKIELRRAAVGHGDVELASGDYVVCSVIDTGSGMPLEVAQRAFDPFFTTKPVGRGTGLGLSQAYSLARLSGGTARIASEAGRGTQVALWLRATDTATASGVEVMGDAEPPRGMGQHILIVDDEPDIRQAAAEMLESQGYRCSMAADGVEALQKLQLDEPALLLLDFAMPGLSGPDVARVVRGRWPQLPILFVSGHADLEALQAAAAGTRLLRKPFGARQLFAAVHDLLGETP